jgi:benzoyl-CoA reductase/2-hydroxyglutaryl-CoA dehydratase subunit BcrC/BadD/HgdB
MINPKRKMNRLESLKLLKEINSDYYRGAHQAHEENKHICYVNAFTPVELLYAMDVIPIYPENHAVIVASRRMTGEFSSLAEKLGYGHDICSYGRIDLGSIKLNKNVVEGGLPKPDFLLVCNAQCNTLVYWWEALSRYYHVPLFLIDVPQSSTGAKDEAAERYVKKQIENLVPAIEEITGRKLNRSHFEDVLALSREGSRLWNDIIDIGLHKPSPMTVFDQFIAMAPIVAQRGCKVTIDFYEELKKELQNRVRSGVGAVLKERFRLYWDNLPMWTDLRALAEYLDAHDACLVTSMYTWAWANLSVGSDDPFQDWMEQYLYFFNFDLKRRVRLLVQFQERFSLNGFIYHSNRSCKVVSFDAKVVRRKVTEETKIPGVIIEGDHCDPQHYSFDQITQQLDIYFEILNGTM